MAGNTHDQSIHSDYTGHRWPYYVRGWLWNVRCDIFHLLFLARASLKKILALILNILVPPEFCGTGLRVSGNKVITRCAPQDARMVNHVLLRIVQAVSGPILFMVRSGLGKASRILAKNQDPVFF